MNWRQYLICPELWGEFRAQMPTRLRKAIDNPSGTLGIGKCEEHGWFMARSRRNIAWSEKNDSR